MSRKTKQPDQNIDLEAISRRNNEGAASASLRLGADDLRVCNAVDFKLTRRASAAGLSIVFKGKSRKGRDQEIAVSTDLGVVGG
jgi:hypothetical protein